MALLEPARICRQQSKAGVMGLIGAAFSSTAWEGGFFFTGENPALKTELTITILLASFPAHLC